jgi:DNA repair protein RAD50
LIISGRFVFFDLIVGVFKTSRNDQKLVDSQQKADEIRETVRNEQKKEQESSDEWNKIGKSLDTRETQKRILADNLKLKQYVAQAAIRQKEMERMSEKMKNHDFDKVDREKRKINEHVSQLEREQSERTGRLGEVVKRIEDVTAELNEKRLKSACKMFREKQNEKFAREQAAKDLNVLYGVVDKSVMTYHQERMKGINQIIKDLWRATYKGNDIDYIEIKNDAQETMQGADKRRSYNYRVVMMKNDSELEMRGRCSAGQKVLASLIIRLSLAETFSANCGVIALDEPTTNLDQENISSLADALSNLVDSRRNSNFQARIFRNY